MSRNQKNLKNPGISFSPFLFSRCLSLSLSLYGYLLFSFMEDHLFLLPYLLGERETAPCRRLEHITVSSPAWGRYFDLSPCARCHSWFRQLWSEGMSHIGQRQVWRNDPFKLWEDNPGHHRPQKDTSQFSHTLKLSHCTFFHPGGITILSFIYLFIPLCIHQYL